MGSSESCLSKREDEIMRMIEHKTINNEKMAVIVGDCNQQRPIHIFSTPTLIKFDTQDDIDLFFKHFGMDSNKSQIRGNELSEIQFFDQYGLPIYVYPNEENGPGPNLVEVKSGWGFLEKKQVQRMSYTAEDIKKRGVRQIKFLSKDANVNTSIDTYDYKDNFIIQFYKDNKYKIWFGIILVVILALLIRVYLWRTDIKYKRKYPRPITDTIGSVKKLPSEPYGKTRR